MFSFVLGICLLFAASAVTQADPLQYAEDGKNFDRQHLKDLTDQNVSFVVLKRDYDTETLFHCLTADKVLEMGNGSYEYRLTAKHTYGGKIVSYLVVVDAERTGNHTTPNSAFYEERPGGGRQHHRIMTRNNEKSCFLMTVPFNGQNGCLLVVRKSEVGNERNECEEVYERECGNHSVILYDQTCY